MHRLAPRHNWVRQLQRFAAPPTDHCDVCNAAIPPEHAHLVDIENRRLLCSCRACAATTSRTEGSLRLPPRRARALSEFHMSDSQWDSLQLPIDMAFIFHSTPLHRPIALYPGPAGATESLLALEGWGQLVTANPILNTVKPDVEALLVNRTQGSREHYVVPIDRCYALVGTIRRQWHGLSGGSEVREAVGEFFARLRSETQERAA